MDDSKAGPRRGGLGRRGFAAMGLGLLGAPLIAGNALSQDAAWPTRPIRIIMPFAAGGGTDLTARLLAQRMSEKLGVSIVVENRAGGQGNIGAQLVARAAPDGTTFLYNTSFIVTSPPMAREMSYDWRRDLTPVVGVASVPLILLVHPSVPVRTAAEFVALVKRDGERIAYASAGIGNTTHLAALRLLQEVGATATHIPYSGGGPALTDLLRGVVQFYMDTLNTALPHIPAGTVRAIAVGSPQRVPMLPDLPTVAETVAPGYTAESWQGVMAPAGTSPAIIEKFSATLLETLAEPAIRAKLAESAIIPMALPTAAYRAYLEDEATKWRRVIEAARLRLD
jgi:tripartite-type tricarboxylate transporter receptor subunit TctC